MLYNSQPRKRSRVFIASAVAGLAIAGSMNGLTASAKAAAQVPSPFNYSFSQDGVLWEADTHDQSSSAYWWVASGGQLRLSNGVGRTMEDKATIASIRENYAAEEPVKSNNGYYPQNVFELATRSTWQNSRQSMSLLVKDDNLLSPDNVKADNGVFLTARRSGDSYYALGVQMDGKAVIKKINGSSASTLASKSFLSGTYNKTTNPNLIPKGQWFALRTETINNSNGSVSLKLYVDKANNGNWQLAAEAVDTASPLASSGFGGVKSDFVDLHMDNYRNETVGSTNAPAPAPEPEPTPEPESPAPEPESPAPAPESSGSSLLSVSGTVSESGSASGSNSSQWWVNSGGYFHVNNGVGSTIQGSLPSSDKWRVAYASANPYDTDDGYHPQNIFRLVSKAATWKNFEQQAYFKVNKTNMSDSSNRAGHNALLFFNRYADGNNLYYTGLRVDGKAVIKKKQNGKYTTLATPTVFSGSYNRSSNPNLLPQNKWIGIKSVVKDNADGSVSIKVYMDEGRTGNWKLVAEATDRSTPIKNAASIGIRTDFMDVDVTEYTAKNL